MSGGDRIEDTSRQREDDKADSWDSSDDDDVEEGKSDDETDSCLSKEASVRR